MDSIAINTPAESKWVKNLIRWRQVSLDSGWQSWSGQRSFTTSGLEVESATSRGATGRTCNQQFSMDGNIRKCCPWCQNIYLSQVLGTHWQEDPSPKKVSFQKVWPFWQNISISRCRYCDWSRSGGLKKPQPDNRQNTFHLNCQKRYGIQFHLNATSNLLIWSGRQSRAGRTRVALGSSTTSTKTASSGTTLSAGTRSQSFVR